MQVRKASHADLDGIKAIADANKDTLGFVLRPALAENIARQWVLVAESNSRILGFCNFRHRRDRQTTIYEICVSQGYRGQGIGRAMIEALAKECQSCIRLKAMQGIAANDFYRHLGFQLVGTEQGKKRVLNLWILSIVQGKIAA